jgi:hypothetical protein
MSDENNSLVVLGQLTPSQVFTEGKMDPLLAEIHALVKNHVPDISTVKGRKEIASLALKVAKSKTYLDELGKNLVSEWKEKSKKVDDVRKTMRDQLDILKDEARKPLTDWENKETERIKKHEANILAIELFKKVSTELTSGQVHEVLSKLLEITIDDSWDEFIARAELRKKESKDFLVDLLEKRMKHETEQEELRRFREADEIRKKKEHEENIAKEAAAKAKAEAERIAQEAADKARQESERLEKEKQAEVSKRVMAEEAAKRAEQKAKQDKIDADARAKEAAEKAKKDQEDAIERAREEERVLAAKKKEQEEKELAKREANVKHLKLVNGEALRALVACTGIDEETGKKIITAIAKGEIPNVKINY